MPRDKVSAKIEADAKARVAEIQAEFAERQKKLEEEHEERKKAIQKETTKLVRIEEERIRLEILTEARLQARKEILTARHELINQVLAKAAEKFTKSKGYPILLARIVAEHGSRTRVLLSASDCKRFAKSVWAKNANEAPIKGGVILRTPAKDFNFSIDAAFEALGEELTLQIAEILYSNEKAPKPTKRSTSKQGKKR
jgi:vacuolar-type H+-ATPase subunit E/Vma4